MTNTGAETTAVHTRLLKCALEVDDSRAYWAHAQPGRDPSADEAYGAYRFGAKCHDRIHVLLTNFRARYDAFWPYHPERGWAWELRLQDEIGPEFRIEEPAYRPGGRDLGDGGDVPQRAAFLRDHPDEALAAIEKEAVRRMGRGRSRKVVTQLRLLEADLWTDHPEALGALELRLSEKQSAELHILAPDEPAARSAFERAHPDRVRALFDDPTDDDLENDDDIEDDEEAP